MPEAENQPSFQFDGFTSPNGTIVPDDVFDVLMPRLSDPELRVLLYIIRRTFGFKKQSDNISLRQMVDGIRTRDGRVLDGGTGMSKASVARGLKGLTRKGVINAVHNSSRERGNEPTTYSLRFKNGPVSQSETGGVSHDETRGASQPETGPVSPVDPQQTAGQQTEISLSNIRKAAAGKGLLAGPEQPRSSGDRPLLPLSQLITAPRVTRTPKLDAGDPDRDTILEYIRDFSREFQDRASLKSSTTRAYHLYQQSRVDLDTFIEGMYRARAVVRERTGSIRAGASDEHGRPMRNKMAYWFTVLEDLLGLRGDPTAPGAK